MGDAYGQLTVGKIIDDLVAICLASEKPVNLLLHTFGASEGIIPQGALEGSEAFGGVVETGDGLKKRFSREVCAEFLEIAKCTGHFHALLGRFNHIVRACAINEGVNAPNITFLILCVGLAIQRRHESKGAAVRVLATLLPEHAESLCSDAAHIFHEGDGLFEDIAVDARKDVVHTQTRLIHFNAVGVVDMPGAIGGAAHVVRAQVEQAGDSLEIKHDRKK